MSGPLAQIIKILVASPSDVPEERKIAQEVINEWSNANAEERRVTLQALLWELDAAPETGERTQEIINKQIVDSCHFAIGIFWTRIGTDTGVAPGGAIEEVERVMSKKKLVMLYFSNVPQHPKKIDPQQKAKLDQYRASIEPVALVEEYEDLHEFRRKLTRQLDRQVRRWFCQPEPDSDGVSFESEKLDLKNNGDLLRYQAALKEELRWIRMLGLPGIERIDVNLDEDTFVPLRFSRRHEASSLAGEKSMLEGVERDYALTLTPNKVMQEAFIKDRRMLLVIGDPGSGKTTLLKYYALCALDSERCQMLGFAAPVNVFYLPLRDLVRKKYGSYDTLPANLSRWIEYQQVIIGKQFFDAWLRRGTVLILLDGLDEISDREERKEVCRWIEGAWRGFSTAYFVVTSRGTGYRKAEGIELEVDYERTDVQDFSPAQQERFLKNWFRAAFLREHGEGDDWVQCQQTKADKLTEKSVAHLNEEKNRGLRQLAAIPMILQIMAILWKNQVHLPRSRVKLYNAVLDYLLEIRDERRGIRPLLSAEDARMVLAPVALWMQEELKKDEVEKGLMQDKMQERLEKLDNPPSAANFCDYLVKRADLLVEYGKEYVFRHKSFREYLAGVELLKKVNRTSGYIDCLITGFAEDWWDEPLRFFIAQGDEENFDLFMEKLFDSSVSDDVLQKKQTLLLTLIEEAPLKKMDALCQKLRDANNSAVCQRVILDCLKAIGKSAAIETLLWFKGNNLAKNSAVVSRAEEVLLALEDRQQEEKSGRSVLGDNRMAVLTMPQNRSIKVGAPSFRNPNEHHAEYIRIPGGRYLYSVTKKKERVEDLYIAKYPVTNKLYRSFIAYMQSQAPEYEKQLPLTVFRNTITYIAKHNTWDAGLSDYLKEGKKDLVALFRSGRDEDRKFGGDDQPVVSISWYAARAYCLWLSLLESNGEVSVLYRLPTEKEWEYAAAGKKGRQYPWGNAEPTKMLANYDSNEGATTPEGRYPDGATPEGLYDMAGNVWEWMEDWYDKNTSDEYISSARALRGGSWGNIPGDLRCAARSGGRPAVGSGGVGFRVVRSSPSS